MATNPKNPFYIGNAIDKLKDKEKKLGDQIKRATGQHSKKDLKKGYIKRG